MKIGVTYDLRDDYLAEGYSQEETAEFDRADTVLAIEQALQALGYQTDLIGNIRSLTGRLAAGESWDLVFNIAEGLWGFGREAQVPALLDAYNIPYTFSDALVLSLALHKGMTKHVLRSLGIPTAEAALVETEDDIAEIKLPLPLFAKPVAEGSGKGITAAAKITTWQEMTDVCRKLLVTYRQPVIVETYLPGREFTVGIVGTGKDANAIGVMEVHLKDRARGDSYSYFHKENYEELVEYRLVNDNTAWEARENALAAWRGLGGRDAGRIDLRADVLGRPNIMEVNPLAGLHPQHSDLPILCNLAGIAYEELIGRIMRSALQRIGES